MGKSKTRSPGRKRAVHIIRQVVIILILLPAIVGLYLYFSMADHSPEAQEVAAPAGPVAARAVEVQPQDVPLEPVYLAQTVASQTVPIRTRVSGYLIERSFEEGSRVKAGQVLYRIDPEPYEVALAQAQAQLSAARARLERANQQLARFEELAEVQSAAASELEQWQEEQSVARAEADLQQARVAQAQLDLDYATIVAPITGEIGESHQDVGSYLSATGNPLLATIHQVDPIYVRFSISEQDLLHKERLLSTGEASAQDAGLKVQVILGDGRLYPHRGTLDYVDVVVDPSTGTAVMRATVPNPQGMLRPGQFVNVRIIGMERTGALLVPQGAVMQTPAGASVYVVDQRGEAQTRPVEPGEWYGDRWIIDAGLEAGDRVIIDHLMQIQPGTRVEVELVELPAPQPERLPDAEGDGDADADDPTGAGATSTGADAAASPD